MTRQRKSARASLADMLRANDTAALQAAISEAATRVGLADAKLFTQQGMFSRRIMEAMGLNALDGLIRDLAEGGETEAANRLREGRAHLFEAVFDFVERQIAMRTKNAGRLLREDALSRIRLSNLDCVGYENHARADSTACQKACVAPFAAAQKGAARHVGYPPHHCAVTYLMMAICLNSLGDAPKSTVPSSSCFAMFLVRWRRCRGFF